MQFARLVTEMSCVTDDISFHSSNKTAESCDAATGVIPAVETIRSTARGRLRRRDGDDDWWWLALQNEELRTEHS